MKNKYLLSLRVAPEMLQYKYILYKCTAIYFPVVYHVIYRGRWGHNHTTRSRWSLFIYIQ